LPAAGRIHVASLEAHITPPVNLAGLDVTGVMWHRPGAILSMLSKFLKQELQITFESETSKRFAMQIDDQVRAHCWRTKQFFKAMAYRIRRLCFEASSLSAKSLSL
jgi:hypothetical protein